MQEQEIFQQYELKNWDFSPRLYKILAASAVVNVLFVLGLAQGNVLTAKSCDTPLMSSVCSVVDAIYVGSTILDTDTGFVNEDYVKTELEDADVTFIDLSGQTPPLEYPAGYFAVANPEPITDDSIVQIPGITQNNNPTMGEYIPGITGNTKTPTYKTPTYKTPTYKNPSTSTDLTKVKPIKPKKNDGAVTGDLSSLDINIDPTVSKDQTKKTPNKDTTKDTTKDQTNTTKDTNPTENKTVSEANINKKVLKDYASYVKAKVDKKEVDLNQPFKVVLEGVLTKDGKFDISVDKKTKKAKTGFTAWEGDEQMVDVAKKALEAFGDSGWLIYLRNLGAENVKITLVQDGENILARVESKVASEDRAKTVSSGVNSLISITKMTSSDEDVKTLLKGAKESTFSGNVFILDFAIPKNEAQALIERKLKEVPTPGQSNSTAQTDKDGQAKTK